MATGTSGRLRRFAVLLAFWFPPCASAVHAAEFALEDERRLSRGEILVNVKRVRIGDGAQVLAAVDIPMPSSRVWPIMTDCERAPTFVPGLASCKVLQRDAAGAWDIREHVSSPGWPLPDFRTVFRSFYEPTRRVRFSRVDGDLKRSDGEWLLLPLDGGGSTRVIYTAEVEYDTWVPAFLVRDHLATQMRSVLVALRNECSVQRDAETP